MKKFRKEKVFLSVKDDTTSQLILHNTILRGATAKDISEKLQLDRSNVSRELNELTRENLLIKIKGKPTQYICKKVIEDFSGNILPNTTDYSSLSSFLGQKPENSKSNNDFNELIGYDGSLKDAIKKAKSAILYPPNGLTTLITGETGVGKSLFAEKMYQYGINKKILSKDAPFINFNCADYADNQELLLSQLFGHLKGSYTGATDDKEGIVGEADGGILFLDEVHRLSEKGQEMLFSLMDRGQYHKLGQVKNSSSKCRIIAATTEKPSETMLSTFLRRIPIHIHLESLAKKSIKEKFELICYFFKQESQNTQQNIYVSRDILLLFLFGNFTGNIGHLKSSIQYACASAFLRYVSEDNFSRLELVLSDIPKFLLEQVKTPNNADKNFVYSLPNTLIFNYKEKGGSQNSVDALNYYNVSEIKTTKYLEAANTDTKAKSELKSEIVKYMNCLIADYSKLANDQYGINNKTILETFINKDVKEIIFNAIRPYATSLKSCEYCSQLLTYHISKLVSVSHKVDSNSLTDGFIEQLTDKIFTEIEVKTKKYYTNNDQLFFAEILNHLLFEAEEGKIGIIIIMHGNSTASSMAEVVNQLLKTKHVHAINMHLSDDLNKIYNQAKDLVRKVNEGQGILILADMGSIVTFEDRLQHETQLPIKVLSNVSTPIAIEATNYILSSKDTLESIYSKLVKKNNSFGSLVNKDDSYRYFDQIIIHNLKKILTFLDAEKVFYITKQALKVIIENSKLVLNNEFLVKFIIHCSCMVERSFTGEVLHYKNPCELFNTYPKLYQTVIKSFAIIEQYFGIKIKSEEVANLMDMIIFEYPDNFLTHIKQNAKF
ncbi:sigma 54-interacting transcriptional regulator [Lactobacillus sp. ESL0791]|uniref:sigma 54-interacting transcriptional regulator n=1 Tax=Lactobacillus sp. ESL0791 TaxID=2983234 RepID=UPI0023F71635|nr:sigma 54-interacting transcriptional regulator [Lactobacillus sp. ESL0791]MDF7639801.1 sigma 54-interacting transcriptional regulator [Lactobacillus sp. ESL0791]